MTFKPNSLDIVMAIVLVGLLFFASSGLDKWRQPSPVLECGSKLARLGKSLLYYANDHNDTFPNSFDNLNTYTEGEMPFNCPGSGEKYVIVQNRTFDTPLDSILAYCPEEHYKPGPEIYGNGGQLGMNFLTSDGHVRLLRISDVKALFADQGIDLDKAKTTHNQRVD